jgi:hypothetical protein
MAIEYHLHRFHAYNSFRKKKALTQSVVLSAPMRVAAGEVDALEAGGGITQLQHIDLLASGSASSSSNSSVAGTCRWMRGSGCYLASCWLFFLALWLLSGWFLVVCCRLWLLCSYECSLLWSIL